MLKAVVCSWCYLLAGAALTAALDACLTYAGTLIPRGFAVAWCGALLASLPLLPVIAMAARRRADTALAALLAGALLGAAPFAVAMGLAMPVAAGLSLMAAAAVLCWLRRPLPPSWRRVAGLLPLAAAATVAWGMVLGGSDGPAPVVRDFPARQDAVPSGHPDVLLVSIDTLRADAVEGPQPDGFALPTFDRLKRTGASAPFAHAPSGMTLPSHLTMLTGQDGLTTGVRDNFNPVPSGQAWLAQAFLKAGYRTAGVISNGLLSSDIGFGEGFEVYDDSDVPKRGIIRHFVDRFQDRSWLGLLLRKEQSLKLVDLPLFRAYRSRKMSAASGSALTADIPRGERGRAARTNALATPLLDELMAGERPYFFFLHYMDPHDPYGTIAPFDGSRSASLPPLDPAYAPTADGGISGDSAIAIEAALQSGDPARVAAARQAAAYLHQVYLEEVAFVDQELGKILDRIAASGRPTVVLVTGDHGEHFAEHGLMKHGNSLYHELLDVPFLIAGPGVPAGARFEDSVQLLDVVPTLLVLADIATEDQLQSLPGMPLVFNGQLNPSSPQRTAVDGLRFSYQDGPRKWLGTWAHPESPTHKVDFSAYFDLAADPFEQQDLGEAAAQDLWPAVQRELERDRHDAKVQIGEAQRAMNSELGYVDSAGEAD